MPPPNWPWRTCRIEPIDTASGATQVLSADVPAGGARLFPIQLPSNHGLALGVNGSPLLQMSVFSADGTLLERQGPLRVVSLAAQNRSPVQLLVTNEGRRAGADHACRCGPIHHRPPGCRSRSPRTPLPRPSRRRRRTLARPSSRAPPHPRHPADGPQPSRSDRTPDPPPSAAPTDTP